MHLDSIKQLVQDVIDGNESALKAFAIIKKQSKQIDVCLKAVEKVALEEAQTYEKNFELHGFEFEQRNGSRRFDFKGIAEWTAKKAELSAIEDRARAAYSAYEQKLNTADQDGEVVELPVVTYSKASLIVKAVKDGK